MSESGHFSAILDPNGARRVPRVAFQGTFGAFSELAIRQQWPDGADIVPADSFALALNHLTTDAADFAVIPVENVIAGPVHAAIAALNAMPRLQTVGEVNVAIHLCLMAKRGATIAGLRVVRSHAMALAQSGLFFQRHPWLVPEVHDDTAGAAAEVAQQVDLTVAAIASEAAASRYGLDILARSVEDISDNWTRFVIVSER